MTSNFNSKMDKVMTNEQFTQVVEAILEGKYSWACVLILRFAGYNPLHYIPYRTYNRLMKENCQVNKRREVNRPLENAQTIAVQSRASRITDLNYLEPVQEQQPIVRGGDRPVFVNLRSILRFL